MSDDGRLIEEALAGDSTSFGRLVSKYQDRLFNTLVHSMGSREEAEDVAQDAFVQAYVKLATFRGNSSFYTWLYRIAFNLQISRIRRKRPEVSVEQTRDATGDEPVSGEVSPGEKLEQMERIAQVQASLGQLSEEYRTILVLREMDGCCYETISEILQLPIGTVRSRLHRARCQMRARLQEVLEPRSSEYTETAAPLRQNPS